MKFKVISEKDFTIDANKIKVKPKRVVPTVKVNVTNNDTGEYTEGCDMNITKDTYTDVSPFVKLYRPNLIDKLGRQEFRLFLYIMEKINRWNNVELNPNNPEMYEYTGYKYSIEMYIGIKALKKEGILTKLHNAYMWHMSEDVMQRWQGPDDRDTKKFVKIYEPRQFMQLGAKGRALLSYICVAMGYDGYVHVKLQDFLLATGYKDRKTFNIAKKELVAAELIKDVLFMTVREEGEKFIRESTWYRVNPNVMIKGNRLELGYNVR